jgi:hypothetical protein
MMGMDLNNAIEAMEGQPGVVGKIKIPIEAGVLARGTVSEWLRYATGYNDLKVNYFEQGMDRL